MFSYNLLSSIGTVLPSSDSELPSIELDPEFTAAGFDFSGVDVAGWIIAVFLIAVVAIIAIPTVIYTVVTSKFMGKQFVFTTKDLAYGAVCLAMSYGFSLFGISLNLGGTITFASILPVAVYCYYFGFRKGLIITTVFMLLQLTQGPYIVSPWSMLLDYVIPYMALSLIGLFGWMKKKNAAATGSRRFAMIANKGFYIGMAAYIVVRYASHILSGILFWDLWYSPAPASYAIAYCFVYNSFCLIDCFIAFVVSLALLSSKNFDKLMTDFMSNTQKRRAVAAGNAASSQNGTDGNVTAQSDGLTNSDTSAESDKRA